MNDPYAALGVAKTATQDEIKKAYRELAKKHHPDLNPGNSQAEARFKEASQAYEQIGTPEARAKFDQGESDEQRQQQEWQQAQARAGASYYRTQQTGGRYSQAFGDGAEDIFEEIFRRAGRTAAASEIPGEDHYYRLEVEFKDAALGAEREIVLPSGKKLLIKIPAGVEAGTKLRFKQQGGAGSGGAPPGDAYVEISVKPQPGFTRVGNNIESVLPISLQEAILGGEVRVPTVDGQVMLKVPPGSSTGTRLRIRGKGVGAEKDRGDQIVNIHIVLPKRIDPALQEAVRGWESKFHYNPRAKEGES
jgi:DnaJ-class molecular chaperone